MKISVVDVKIDEWNQQKPVAENVHKYYQPTAPKFKFYLWYLHVLIKKKTDSFKLRVEIKLFNVQSGMKIKQLKRHNFVVQTVVLNKPVVTNMHR